MNKKFPICIVLLIILAFPWHIKAENPPVSRLVSYLQTNGQEPAEYILSKFKAHRIVLIGEHHWVKHDVSLISDLMRRLPYSGVGTLAMEVLPAAEQKNIDRIITAEKWNYREAAAVFRKAAWPYKEYLEILHTAWEMNNSTASAKIYLLALSPGFDWREQLLPKGRTYDSFMADRVLSGGGGGQASSLFTWD